MISIYLSSSFFFFPRLISAAVAKLCGVEQRAPPIFGRATIRLGIGPHSSSSSIYLSFYLFFLAQFQRPQSGCLPYFYTRRGPSANLECRSEMCCWLEARCKYRTQKSRQKSPSGHHRTNSSGYIFASKARIDNRKQTC